MELVKHFEKNTVGKDYVVGDIYKVRNNVDK